MVDSSNSEANADSGRQDREQAVRLTDEDRAELEKFRRTHETQVLTIYFSDLVGSTRLQTQLGNLRATELVHRHYGIIRQVLAGFDGREIKTAGDSMLIVFAAPSEAVKFAIHAQRAMRLQTQSEPQLPPMRAGIHQGQVVLQKDGAQATLMDVYGLQVSTAARIMDLSDAGQVLLSRSVFDDARAILRHDEFPGFARLAWRNHGPYRFKGVDDDYEVCEVGEEGSAPLRSPPASGKGWPADKSLEELGWRPAAGIVVPETNWQLVGKLGQGEFGEVWKAFNLSDKSYQVFKFCFRRDRLPALKREARLLKRLRKYAHPSLVEVYDVTEGERPPHYLEMEFVDGPSSHEWLATAPPLPARLEIVAQIAEALDTVHAAGIFHRDIKPANILLTRREDGELRAKLVDFGLGAAQDPDLLRSIYASRAGGVSGTWDYLAPELRHGGRASAQSDIFSLGMTLYQIAVGDLERPLTADWEQQIESEVLRDDIRQCVSQSPADRWGRAADLAQALRSHEQRQRQRELERDHQAQKTRARRLRRATLLAVVVSAITLVLGGLAVQQWREAARQRDRALAQKRLALAAIGGLTHDVPLRLRDVPGTLPILKGILEENMNLLDRILALEPDTPVAQRERGVNIISIGDRWMLIGDTQRAATAYEEGLRIARELAAGDPTDTTYQRDVSVAHDRLGDVRVAQGDTSAALDAYRISMDMTRNMAKQAPQDRARRRDLWLGLDKLGGVYLKTGRTDEAQKAYEEALEIAGALAKETPDDPVARRDLSVCWERIGDVRLQAGQTDEALAAYQNGMKLGELAVTQRPESAVALRDLSVGYDKLGGVYLKLGRNEEALEAYRSALKISLALSAKEPENTQWQRDVSISQDRLADLAFTMGRGDEALRAYQAGLTTARAMAERDPTSAVAKFDVLAGIIKVGNALLATNDRPGALSHYTEALTLARQLLREDPVNTQVKRSLSVVLNKVAGTQMLLDQLQPASETIEESITLARNNAESDASNMQAQRDLGVSYFNAMPIYEKLGNLDRWREVSRGAVEQLERAYQASPSDPGAKADLMNTLTASCLATLLFAETTLDDVRAALRCAQRLIELSGSPSADQQKILDELQARLADTPAPPGKPAPSP